MTTALRAIGFWFSELECLLPRPQLLVRRPAAGDESSRVGRYLRGGNVAASYRGWSECRFDCGAEHGALGSRDLTDGRWLWPEGLAHYVERHGVALPDEFVEDARARDFQCPEWSGNRRDAEPYNRSTVAPEFWLDWARARDAAIDIRAPWQVATFVPEEPRSNRARTAAGASRPAPAGPIGLSPHVARTRAERRPAIATSPSLRSAPRSCPALYRMDEASRAARRRRCDPSPDRRHAAVGSRASHMVRTRRRRRQTPDDDVRKLVGVERVAEDRRSTLRAPRVSGSPAVAPVALSPR